ncbi:MAG: quinone-dependent dihydroorotate dehydrogenase [Pseudomonadota bacterium]
MRFLERALLPFVHGMDPEKAHNMTLQALNWGVIPRPGPYTSTRLTTEIAGLKLPNPIGLAAGLDKNAEAIYPLLRTGFGFIEVGAATPKPQPGNPKPRLYRLTEDRAAINRFGFNNDGMDVISGRLRNRVDSGIVGLNLGANKASQHRTIDYVKVLETCGPYVDFATINVSSPNTERLRELQGREPLYGLVKGAMETRDSFEHPIPIFLKVAPDIDERMIEDVIEVARMTKIDALICTNTTIKRAGLKSEHAAQKGGLSGAPLFDLSNKVLAQFARGVGNEVPLIGVGGVASGQDAYTKIRLGASAVQLYTALVFEGFSVVKKIAKDLDTLLEADGFDHVSQAVGIDL